MIYLKPIHPVLDFFSEEMTVVVGGKRCFKTLHGVYEAKIAYDHGYELYTNVVLNRKHFPNYYQMNWKDPRVFVEQLRDIMDRRIKEQDFRPAFLLTDEASGVADSAMWKENNKDSDIWKQLGKVGITATFVNQTFSQTYNRIRDNTDVLKVCKRVHPQINNWYTLSVYRQDSFDHTKYNPVVTGIRMCADGVFDYYDTRQVLYLK